MGGGNRKISTIDYGVSYSFDGQTKPIIGPDTAVPDDDAWWGRDGGQDGQQISSLVNKNGEVTIETTIGDIIYVQFDINGDASSWQGGYNSYLGYDSGDSASGSIWGNLKTRIQLVTGVPNFKSNSK